ncbi:DMT family transporter [Sphingomonas nostoxanthinifaciens]|nr:DMT family transporter [Sphingomonas nostoxanthinifaciens]
MVGVALFTLMDAVMKGLSLVIGAYCAMLWRTVVALLTTGLPWLHEGAAWPARPIALLHLQRGAVNAVSATGYFFGLTRLPMAEGIALSFIAPLIALYLSAAMLDERVGWRAIAASLLGLSGVVLLVAARLGGPHDMRAVVGAVAILIAASVYGYGIVLLRRQAQAASPVAIAFFQNAATFLWLAPAALWLAPLPGVQHWPAILAGALLAQASMMLLAWAYARAEAKTLIPAEYTAFIWSALFGALIFGEALTRTVLAGAVLIIAGCVLAALAKSPPPMPTEMAL